MVAKADVERNGMAGMTRARGGCRGRRGGRQGTNPVAEETNTSAQPSPPPASQMARWPGILAQKTARCRVKPPTASFATPHGVIKHLEGSRMATGLATLGNQGHRPTPISSAKFAIPPTSHFTPIPRTSAPPSPGPAPNPQHLKICPAVLTRFHREKCGNFHLDGATSAIDSLSQIRERTLMNQSPPQLGYCLIRSSRLPKSDR